MKLLLASFYKEFIYKIRYFFNTLLTMVLFCVIFAVIIAGYSAISGGGSPFNFGDSTSAMVVSYYAWTMMLSVYTSTGYIVTENKQNGTLENLISNSQHFTTLLICESIVSSIMYFVLSWLIIGALSLLCGITLHFMVLEVFVILMVGLLSVLGLSFIVSGTAMLFRKMDGIMSILQFVLLGGLFLPDLIAVRISIPFYHANQMLMSAFIDGTSLLQFSLSDYAILFGNSLLYMIVGILLFKLCMKTARRKGTLAFY